METIKDYFNSALRVFAQNDSMNDTQKDSLKKWFDQIYPNNVVSKPTAALNSTVSSSLEADSNIKKEIAMKLLSGTIGLLISFTISYYGLKWLMNNLDPTRKEKLEAEKRAVKLLYKLGIPPNVKLTEYERCIAANLVDPLDMVTTWDDIGGLDSVVDDIKDTVILPFHNTRLFQKSSLIQPPKGVLLYGPPGCGKTMIAKAMAKATGVDMSNRCALLSGARFINLQISSLVDKWYGESQKRAEAVFSLAQKLQPTIIFIDEIDSFLRSRASNDHEATSMVKTQFMSFWDGLMSDHTTRIMIVGASNRPNDVDAAILRRMPSTFQISLPNLHQRKQILQVILENEPVDQGVDLDVLASHTEGFSGSDLRELCRNAAISTVRLRLKQQSPAQETAEDTCIHRDTWSWEISMDDFHAALAKTKQSKDLTNRAAFQQIGVD